MKNEHALRYLLLRHLKRFETHVSEPTFWEVTNSLQVTADRNFYKVAWTIGNKQKTKSFKKDEFIFYSRGDTKPKTRSIKDNLANNNDLLAQSFAKESLNINLITLPTSSDAEEALEPYVRYEIGINILLMLVIAILGETGYLSCIILLAILLIEYKTQGRLYSSILFLILAFSGMPGGALIGAIAYAFLQFLDPNPTKRVWRISFCLTASIAILSLAYIGWKPAFHFDTIFIVAFLLAIPLAAIRSLFSIHFRAMPIAMPFVWAGLTLNMQMITATIGIFFYVLSIILIAYGYKWWPVQREQKLTPNG